MYAVKAVYDGVTFKPQQPITAKGKHEVIITFLEPIVENLVFEEEPKKRPLSELRGFLKGKVRMADDFNAPLEEMKEYME